MPTTTVPPKDFVLRANTKVGMATNISGCQKTSRRGSPEMIRAGTNKALRIDTGIRSSHSTNQLGNRRLGSKNNGIHRGKKVTNPMPSTVQIKWL